MDSKLYVGNLPYSTTDQVLKDLFGKAGTVVSVSVITDRETGRSKGFAFVEMSNQTEAEKAIQMFNGYSLDRRELRVSIARPKETKSSGSYGGGKSNAYSSQGNKSQNHGSDNNSRY